MSKQKNSEKSSKLILEDIARDLGLSISTVSRAISGKGRISEATRKKVLGYISMNNLRPNVIDRAMPRSHSYNIAVVFEDDTDISEKAFFMATYLGILEMASIRDYNAIAVTVKNQNFSEIRKLINQGKADGVIVTSVRTEDSIVDWLKESGAPFVVMGSPDGTSTFQVDFDHRSACRELALYLLGREGSGIKTALMVENLEHTANRLKYEGCQSAFAEVYKSKNALAERFLLFDGVDTRIKVEKFFEESLKQGVNCFLCGDELVCSRLLSLIDQSSYTIPKDLRVASLHDSSALQFHNPPVTAIQTDDRMLGQQACKILLDLIERNTSEITIRTILPHSLVIRQST